MPTVGWILEGDRDRYFAAVSRAESPRVGPPRVLCPFCSRGFASIAEMLDHLAGSHRGDRPILLVRGQEPPANIWQRYATGLDADDVLLRNCTEAAVSINGESTRTIKPGNVPELLSTQRDSLIELRLGNLFEKSAVPISARYQMLFQVPDRAMLDAVDSAFQKHLAREHVDFGSVDAFLTDRACGGQASGYCEALGSYVRGLLVKDRPAHAAVSLPFAKYRSLYRTAEEALQPFHRPLPVVIRAIVQFALNNFSTPIFTGFGLLDDAVRTLVPLAGLGDLPSAFSSAGGEERRIDLCPIDDGVSRILDLRRRLAERASWSPAIAEECRQVANAKTLDAPDREKGLVLWANAALKVSVEAAAEPLRLLLGVYPFGTWASSHLERSMDG
ncbi:MAG: hypothetical protein P4L90_06460 [Rhodopila sp.]|nr:hypothetical protein [Rhodopila sp.]